jgi:hypothetical protein
VTEQLFLVYEEHGRNRVQSHIRGKDSYYSIRGTGQISLVILTYIYVRKHYSKMTSYLTLSILFKKEKNCYLYKDFSQTKEKNDTNDEQLFTLLYLTTLLLIITLQ